MAERRTRKIVVVAQDPEVRGRDGKILTTRVVVPWEDLREGPTGHRVHVVDYDASTATFYKPAATDDVEEPDPSAILGDPGFHARNVYAIVMHTLGRFEYALGRRVGWGFRAHQLKVVPHAFEEMNAFYAPEAESLLFGYYPGAKGTTFMCLSHDIVVHETTHALVDGLRRSFMAPSSPDQAAFHEGFADVVALLSVFRLRTVLDVLISRGDDTPPSPEGLIRRRAVTEEQLKKSVLLGLADEMSEAGVARANALRRSVDIEPDVKILDRLEFLESHRRGEILVAAIMRAFVETWARRLESLSQGDGEYLDLARVAEEGASIADVLLTMAIRALDYTPPIHLEFGDYLSALLTADSEVRTDDSRYRLRDGLLEWFASYGISPASETRDGLWKPSDLQLANEGVRFGSLQTDPVEMFRLIWANRENLSLDPTAFTWVASVRPCVRTSPDDGLPLRETVAECRQYVKIQASELGLYGLKKPAGMADETPVELEGGSTLLLDEYGRLKYEVHQRLPSAAARTGRKTAQARLNYLWEQGFFAPGSSFASRLARIHRLRAGEGVAPRAEVW